MVCEKCEKKLGKVIVPDKWKAGASNTLESGGRKVGENKLLSAASKSKGVSSTSTATGKCRICKSPVHQTAGVYCHNCSYKLGICAICGRKVLDTKFYKQSAA
eukprot:jgi/Chlat1/8643/Chrsp87S08038